MDLTIEQVIIFLGIVVFLVNVVVEVSKNVWPLDQLHTNYYVTVLSIVFTVIGYLVYSAYFALGFVWYYFVGSIILGFIAAYLAMFGWEKLIKLWQDSKKIK